MSGDDLRGTIFSTSTTTGDEPENPSKTPLIAGSSAGSLLLDLHSPLPSQIELPRYKPGMREFSQVDCYNC